MPKQLNFFKFSERIPEHDQEIWYVKTHNYGGYEFKYGTVEWSWLCLDEDGHYDGSSIGYSKDYPQPENTKLSYFIDGTSLLDDFLWAPVEEIEKVIFDD